MEIANMMEAEQNKPKPKDKNALSEDEALAAFAEFNAGDGNLLLADPAKIAAEKKKKEETARA